MASKLLQVVDKTMRVMFYLLKSLSLLDAENRSEIENLRGNLGGTW